MAKGKIQKKVQKPGTGNRTSSSEGSIEQGGDKTLDIKSLHLDASNPRFGAAAGEFKRESDVLNHIVTNFGIDDVLSSIAVNGFFESEPILVLPRDKKLGGGYVVAEGNRRLAACLILARDARASQHEKRAAHFNKIRAQYGNKPFNPIPVKIFSSEDQIKELTPYLGVRHIAGAQQWDSYAKAAWVANAVDRDGLALQDIVQMIGDDTGLAKKMLEGYYVTQQLIDEGRFDPNHSQRKGLRSNPEFPFSWVYTIFGFKPVREWLKLPGSPQKNPLTASSIEKAETLFAWMFGQEDSPPLIADSRELAELAKCIAQPPMMRLLRDGKSVKDTIERSKPKSVILGDRLTRVHELLREIVPVLSEEELDEELALELRPTTKSIKNLAIRIHREIDEIANGQGDTNE